MLDICSWKRKDFFWGIYGIVGSWGKEWNDLMLRIQGQRLGQYFLTVRFSAAHNFEKFIEFFNTEVYFSKFVKVIVCVAVSMSSIGLFRPIFSVWFWGENGNPHGSRSGRCRWKTLTSFSPLWGHHEHRGADDAKGTPGRGGEMSKSNLHFLFFVGLKQPSCSSWERVRYSSYLLNFGEFGECKNVFFCIRPHSD